ncbi:asparaginase [Mailhella massiliensis]|uniref:asparaginase n=1 Tax=Mailhella massiliensis TaxID=1903261 RepID=A0A921AVK9_9BACT|nr:asparaginase [Mailhella massiliensis]HJD97140.1 asparaginase [Mailhella massiliensis]
MKDILMLATGGTIACEPSEDGLVPKLSGEAMLKSLGALPCRVSVRELMNLDSSNLQPEDWEAMARAVADSYEDFDGFVITHGTDTLAYTAAALYQMLRHLAKPVILTGSQLPMAMEGSDAPRNLRDAFFTACEGVGGVYVVFHGEVIDGARAKKMHTERFAAYASVNAPLAKITPQGVQWRERRSPDGKPFCLVTGLEKRVCVLKLIPGTRPELLDMLVDAGYRGVIIEGFGAGGVPNDARGSFLPSIQRAVEKGVVIVCASQCVFDGVDLSRYPIGVLAARLGAVSGGDKTVEILAVRLMQALHHCRGAEEVRAFMERPV